MTQCGCVSILVEPILLEERVHFTGSLMEGDTASFSCAADGYPLPNIVWLHNNTFVTTSEATRRSVVLTPSVSSPRRGYISAYSSTLQVSGLRLRDAGQYRCRVDPVILDVGTSALSSPFDLTVLSGEKFQF